MGRVVKITKNTENIYPFNGGHKMKHFPPKKVIVAGVKHDATLPFIYVPCN